METIRCKLKCKTMMCQQFLHFEMPLTAFDFDKNLLPLPGQFIFH